MLGDFLINGQAGTTANVGDTIQLIIPGYSQVWLVQTQNGQPQYNDVYIVPSTPYVLKLQDAGYFQGSAYTVTADRRPGQLISSWTFTVHAAGYQPQTILPSMTPAAPGQPPIGASTTPLAPAIQSSIIPPDVGPGAAPPMSTEEAGAPAGFLGLEPNTLLLIGGGVLLYLLLRR